MSKADTPASVAAYLIKKYSKLLSEAPSVAMQICNSEADVQTAPTAYRLVDGNLQVDEHSIFLWVQSQWPRLSTVRSAMDLLLDRPLSEQDQLLCAQHQYDMATGENLCKGPPVIVPLTVHEMQDPFKRVLQSWSDFVRQFCCEALWAHPIVIYAHYSHTEPSLSVFASMSPHLKQGVSDDIANVMTSRTALGGLSDEYLNEQRQRYHYDDAQCPYPINRIMRSWVRHEDGAHHRLLCELSALMWMYYTSHPNTWGAYVSTQDETSRQRTLACRAVYSAYTAFSHEFLRVYPQLILTISHSDTLEQIQMEHDLFHEDFNNAWTWLLQAAQGDVSSVVESYQDRFIPGYSPVDHALVSVDDLAAAGCDLGYLKDAGYLPLLFNTARTPKLDATRSESLRTYTIEGVLYVSSAPRLITHEDQLSFQAGGHRTPPHLLHRQDMASAYPKQEDPYAKYRSLAISGQAFPHMDAILSPGEFNMNPANHFQNTGYNNNWATQTSNLLFASTPPLNQPQQPQQRLAHMRYQYNTMTLFMPDGQQLILSAAPQFVENLKQQQRQEAARGNYLKTPIGSTMVDVLFNDITIGPSGHPMVRVVMVSPQVDGHPSLAASMADPVRQEVPAYLLPQIPMNEYATGAPTLPERDPLVMNGFAQQQRASALTNTQTGLGSALMGGLITTPQPPAVQGKPSAWVYVHSHAHLLQSAPGTLWDDGSAVWMLDDLHGQSYIGPSGSVPSERMAQKYLNVTPRARYSAFTPTVQAPPVEVTPTVVPVVEAPAEQEYKHPVLCTDPQTRGYWLEREWVAAHGGEENPIVAIDNSTLKTIRLDQLCGQNIYLEGNNFSWRFQNATHSEQMRWKTQYKAAKYWHNRPAPEDDAGYPSVQKPSEPTQVGNAREVAHRLNQLLESRAKIQLPAQEPELPRVAIPISITPSAPIEDESDIVDGEEFLGDVQGEDIAKAITIEGDGEGEFQICVHDVFHQHDGVGLPAPAIPWSRRLSLVKARRTGNRMWLVLERDPNDPIPAVSFASELKVNVDEAASTLRETLGISPVVGAPDISVSLTFMNVGGEIVEDGPIAEKIEALDLNDTEAVQQLAADESLDVAYTYNYAASSDQSGVTPAYTSIAQAIRGLRGSTDLMSTTYAGTDERFYHPLTAAMCEVYRTVGDANFAAFLKWMRDEGGAKELPIYAVKFSQWLKGRADSASATQSTLKGDKPFKLSGQLTAAQQQGLNNLRSMSMFNAMITQLINRALRQQYGLNLTINSYIEDIETLRQQIADGGEALKYSWAKTESDIIEQLLEDLKVCEDYAAENEHYGEQAYESTDVVYVRSTLVLALAARYQDLDIQLDNNGQGRSIPLDCNAITSALLDQLDNILKAYEADWMSAPLQELDIIVSLIDGVTIKLNMHPTMAQIGKDQSRWMASLVEIL